MDSAFIAHWAPIFAVFAIWELIWKGLGLWRAARRDERAWFVAILVVNSVGLLPIIYLVMTSPKKRSGEPTQPTI